jgi:CDGSH-type Zn-finger protein
MVRHEADGPYRIDPQDKPVFVCGCGLSQDLPFCDGSHKACKQEDTGTVYVYDSARQAIVEKRPDSG